MEWETLQYTLGEIDEAGKILVRKLPTFSEMTHAFEVIDNWRAVHAFPLNTFQVGLRRKAGLVEQNSTTAQRIKRLSSIRLKLERMPSLRLSEMQDIGGCRAVLNSVQDIEKLVKIYKTSDIKHKLIDEDDYIKTPRKSGYRSHHLIYSYYSDKKATYNGRKIEVQIRSKLQHAWATAVETVGTFTRQALKSSQGEKDWLRFFALMGTVIALKEGTPAVANTPTQRTELLQEMKNCATSLQVEVRLAAYGSALQALETKGVAKMYYHILALDPGAQTVVVKSYKFSDLDNALKDYTQTEREFGSKPGGEAVLVSVDSLTALRRAYPNYFLDTETFRNELKSALAGKISI